MAEKAKYDPNVFCEYVLKDSKTGRGFVQAKIHKELQSFIDKNKFVVIVEPRDHGKSEQVAIGRVLYELGRNPNIRIKLVSQSDDEAKDRLRAIVGYIERDEDLHRVFPELKPAQRGEWTKHSIIVERTTRSKDASVEALGILSTATGGRADLLILDDPCDFRNSIQNPALRKTVKEAFRNVWVNLLEPEGRLIYIATLWHTDDLTHELLGQKDKYPNLFRAIDSDYTPLWPGKWTSDRLKEREEQIGKRAFDRSFRNIALSDEEKTFPSANQIFHYGVKKEDVVNPNWPRYFGVDPFGQWVVIFILALSPEGKKYPIDIIRMKGAPLALVDELVAQYHKRKPQIIMLENNAAQEAMRQWVLERGHDIPVSGFVTGKQKADPMIGLPSLEVEFANGSWVVPMGDEHPVDCKCGFCVWHQELNGHPIWETDDTVLASWFAREATRLSRAPVQIFV